MTGFGQATYQADGVTVKVEIRTVNHRFLEFAIRMPRDLLMLEEQVRSCLAAFVERGRVDVYVAVDRGAAASRSVAVDWVLFEALVRAEEEALARTQGIVSGMTPAAEWLRYPDVLRVDNLAQDTDAVLQVLVPAVEAAGAALGDMRRREGERLHDNLQSKLTALDDLVDEMDRHAQQAGAAVRDRLRQKLADLRLVYDESRLLTESALLAERAAIDEELVRLRSHQEEFVHTMAGASPVGRKLDFLAQEMHRELNTIAAKIVDAPTARAAVEAKTIVEQVREQVQNLE